MPDSFPPLKTWGYSKGWPGKQGKNRSPLVVALIFFLVGPPPGCDIDEAVSIEMVVDAVFEMLYRLRPLVEWVSCKGNHHRRDFPTMMMPHLNEFHRRTIQKVDYGINSAGGDFRM